MSAVRIGTLNLQVPRADAAPAATRLLEEAFRTCGFGWDGRLLLIRRLRLGRIGVGGARPAALAVRIADLLREAARAAGRSHLPAVPGGAAAQPDAVLFDSAALARAALACALLRADRPPVGWWWRQAVPEWEGGANPVRLLLASVRSAEGRAALAIEAFGPGRPLIPPSAIGPEAAALLMAAWPAPPVTPTHAAAGPVWLALQRRIAMAPHLASERRWALDVIAGAVTRQEYATTPDVAPPEKLVGAAPAGTVAAAPNPVANALRLPKLRPVSPFGEFRPSSGFRQPRLTENFNSPAARPRAIEVAGTAGEEAFSRFAGLYLTVQTLRRLGIAERLAKDPRLAETGFGWRLLDGIAARLGAPAEDPVRLALWREGDAPQDLHANDAVALWRVALDGWLRRRCGLPLSALVRRPGWIQRSEAALAVRFTPGAADVRLRRRGVDIDPGFVHWLGISLRFRYDDGREP